MFFFGVVDNAMVIWYDSIVFLLLTDEQVTAGEQEVYNADRLGAVEMFVS